MHQVRIMGREQAGLTPCLPCVRRLRRDRLGVMHKRSYGGGMSVTPLHDPDHILALGYASTLNRELIACLFSLDERMARTVLGAREVALAQIRLAWWRDQLLALGTTIASPNDPLLQAIKALEIDPVALTSVIDGWEVLLGDDALDAVKLVEFAQRRGGAIFQLIDDDPAFVKVGEGWALADLAFRCTSTEMAQQALAQAHPRLSAITGLNRTPRTRALRVLSYLRWRDVQGGISRIVSPGAPRRMWWALRYALAGC
jgi:15-cis-phytoene synthase